MCNDPELWEDAILLHFAVDKGSCRSIQTLRIIYNLILNTHGKIEIEILECWCTEIKKKKKPPPLLSRVNLLNVEFSLMKNISIHEKAWFKVGKKCKQLNLFHISQLQFWKLCCLVKQTGIINKYLPGSCRKVLMNIEVAQICFSFP